VTLTGNSNSNTYPFTFSVENAITLFNANSETGYAFNDLGAPISSTTITGNQTFDVGLPFFLGRSIYTVFEGAVASSYTGPATAIGTSS
jgi:hypothetical protein